MTKVNARRGGGSMSVLILSLALFFFTVPHNVEDFAYGEPARFGLPPLVVVLGLSAVFAAQGLALFWTGGQSRRGLILHAVLGFSWAIAAVAAHVGELLQAGTYRTGLPSVVFLLGIVLVGAGLGVASILGLTGGEPGQA